MRPVNGDFDNLYDHQTPNKMNIQTYERRIFYYITFDIIHYNLKKNDVVVN